MSVLLVLLKSGTFWRVLGALAIAAAVAWGYEHWAGVQREAGRSDQLTKDAKKLVDAQAKIDGLETELGKRDQRAATAEAASAACVKASQDQSTAILTARAERDRIEKLSREQMAKAKAEGAMKEAEIASLRAFASAPPKPQACEATLKATDDILRSVRRK